MTNTLTVSLRISNIGCVRVTQTFTALTLSSTVKFFSIKATLNGSDILYFQQLIKKEFEFNLPSSSIMQTVVLQK